jgi:signal transduction histidine kinase
MHPSIARLRPWLEPAVAVAFLTLWLVGEAGRSNFGGSGYVMLIAVTTAIAISRVQPTLALAAVASVAALQVIGVLNPPLSTTWPVALGVLFVVFVVALEAPERVAFVGLALGLLLAAMFGYLIGPGMNRWAGADAATRELNSFVTTSAISLGLYLAAWALGYALRLNLRELRAFRLLRATTAQLGTTELELAMVQERDRIARDVHDVLAHSLAVVIAQADGARFLGGSAAGNTQSVATAGRTDDALLAIADAARSALIDVRTLVEGLREDEGARPQPTLAEIVPLVDQLRTTGLDVRLEHFGEPHATTPAQELAVYRIVQESLTNAMRHAGRNSSASVSLDWRGPGLALAITSGVGAQSVADTDDRAADEPTGHGIRGMEDRARLAGGWLTAGRSGDEFVVTAFVPTAPSPATAPVPTI